LAHELHLLAVCFDKQNKDSDAVYNFKRAAEIYQKNESEFTRPVAHHACACYHDFARHYLRLGKASEARPYLDKALQLCEAQPGYLDEADLVEKAAAHKA
jgi:hypothetical protein